MQKLSFTWKAAGALAAILLVDGCSTTPVTGRRQLHLMSEAQEVQLGMTSFEQIKKEQPISKDPSVNALVQRVGKRIAAVAQIPDAQWEFVVFDSKEPNAFALPGGKVGIYTGILSITQTEAGLATVIGHEVAHAAAHHGAERVSQSMAVQGVGQLAGAALGASNSRWQQAFQTAYGVGSKVGVELPFSRKQESEADEIGLIYMARAGYNPEEALRFWQRFAQAKAGAGGGTPWFLRTHPLDEKRIADIKAKLPKAMAEYNRAPISRPTPTGRRGPQPIR